MFNVDFVRIYCTVLTRYPKVRRGIRGIPILFFRYRGTKKGGDILLFGIPRPSIYQSYFIRNFTNRVTDLSPSQIIHEELNLLTHLPTNVNNFPTSICTFIVLVYDQK